MLSMASLLAFAPSLALPQAPAVPTGPSLPPGAVDKLRAVKVATPTRTPTPINIGNFVWDDLDGDGKQDAGEPGLSGVTVQLWNGAKTEMLASAVTNASGNYTVVAPLPGAYRVRVVLPGAQDQFSPKDGAGGDDTDDSDVNPSGANLGFTDVINIASNVISISSIDAGIRKHRTFPAGSLKAIPQGVLPANVPTPTKTPTPVPLPTGKPPDSN
jgi:hypothetical protein